MSKKPQPTRRPAANLRTLLSLLIIAVVGTGTAFGINQLNETENQTEPAPTTGHSAKHGHDTTKRKKKPPLSSSKT